MTSGYPPLSHHHVLWAAQKLGGILFKLELNNTNTMHGEIGLHPFLLLYWTFTGVQQLIFTVSPDPVLGYQAPGPMVPCSLSSSNR